MTIYRFEFGVFLCSIALIFWTYIGYFLFLKLVSAFHSRKIMKSDNYPDVSIIITAYNEENRIRQKIENTLALEYPAAKREIIVVSDGSSDATVEIAHSFRDKGVIVSAFSVRRGKHACQGDAIKLASHEIIVFTDATTFLKTDSLKTLLRNFADPKIGCVSGSDGIQNSDGSSSGEGFYVKYEMKVRTLESQVGSLVGVSGSFFGVRKTICQQWYPHMSSDFYLPLLSYMRGFRSVLENDAIGYYSVLEDQKAEFTRKVRTIVHGIDTLFQFKRILSPLHYGFYSLQIISHKLVRWLVPFLMILAFVSNLLLFQQNLLFKIVFTMQLILYIFALLGILMKRLQSILIIKIPFFLVMSNYSILVAWFEYLKGERYITWNSTKR
jgi:cellulose synthase/poly-beta-1,6-N-acetylglucosamine synthase-like glycosyltransferase